MWRQIIWQRSGGYWLFYCSAIYLAVGAYCVFVNNFVPVWLAQIVWLCIIALPLLCNPLARWLNMKENHMFDWLKSKNKMPDNVVTFPEIPKTEVKPPYLVPKEPEPEKPAKIFYRIGVTDQNRVAFSMGQMEITMTKLGCQQMIEQIEVFMNQLPDEEEHADSK